MKKKFVVIFAIMLIALSGGLSAFKFVHADDDEEEDDEDYEDRATVSSQPESSTSSTTKPKTVTQTVVVTPAKIVTETQIQTVLLSDRDHDGIPDSEDPHPDIAEIYIVKDENLNGIVDTFEYGQ